LKNIINPAEYRHKITIHNKTNTSIVDAEGITREVWDDAFPLWAAIDQLESSRLIRKIDNINQEASTRIKTRYNSALAELMRIKVGSRCFDIFFVSDEKAKHIETHLLCGEVLELDKICKVYRLSGNKDSLNRPIKEPQLMAKYPCTFTRKNDSYEQESPNATIKAGYLLYGESIMDIRPGDLLEIDDVKYTASMLYKPRNHHTEVEITLKKDV
jgi:SPP1 family predicted phage head-tail adaptor